jgi:transcriptional antiterminator RfaH
MCRERIIRNGQLCTVQRPLFPRYLFVRVTVQWRFLHGTFGVIGIILDGEVPAVVPDRVIEDIELSAGHDGVVDIQPPVRAIPNQGDPVRIVREPFSGFLGSFVGMAGEERVKVLLSMFGRQSLVEVGRGDYSML